MGEPAMVFASFVPTSFAIIFLATKDNNSTYEDTAGITGGFAGFMCILFALAHTVAVNTKGVDLLKVLILARMSLGVLATIGALSIAAAAGMKGASFVLLYFSFALFSLPEAFMLHSYANALGGQGGRAPPSNVPSSFPGSIGSGMNQPPMSGGMMQPGMMQPGMMQPGMMQPPQSGGGDFGLSGPGHY